MKHESPLWSIEIPEEWEVDQDDYSSSFFTPQGLGALQIAAAKKEGEPVTDDEVEKSARDASPDEVDLLPARLGWFSGLTAELARANTFRRAWWVRSGNALLSITYICETRDRGREDAAIDAVLQSLRPRGV